MKSKTQPEILGEMAKEINANAKKNKSIYTRPIVVNEHTQNKWSNTGLEIRVQNGVPIILATVYEHLPSNQSRKEAEANARLIAKAPEMHQMCEMFFDMLSNNHKDSVALGILSEILNSINPKD